MELRSRSKVRAEFSMASMTDIIFLLLIFFILTSTVVKEPILKIILPKGAKDNVIKQNIKSKFLNFLDILNPRKCNWIGFLRMKF